MIDSRVLLAPDDGSHGPLLRVADDRLGPGGGYGQHDHRDVDVVLVVLAGSLRHEWGPGAELGAGDVAVLRAGAGLRHDEVAGPAGAHVVQTYLRAAEPGSAPRHDVLGRAAGWVDLGRADARLWIGTAGVGEPPGLRIVPPDQAGPETVLVWQLDTTRPAWAQDA